MIQLHCMTGQCRFLGSYFADSIYMYVNCLILAL